MRALTAVLTTLLMAFGDAWAQAPAAGQPERKGSADPAKPAELQVIFLEGDKVKNSIKSRLAADLLVQVQLKDVRPVEGAMVTAVLPSTGAGASFDGDTILTLRTDAGGRVAFRGMRLRKVQGEYLIKIIAIHGDQRATAFATQETVNFEKSEGRIPAGWWGPIIAGAGGILAGVLIATRNGGGNGVAAGGSPTGGGVTPGTPVVTGPR